MSYPKTYQFLYHATTPASERLDGVNARRYGEFRFINAGDFVYWAFADESGRDLFLMDYAEQGATSKRNQ